MKRRDLWLSIQQMADNPEPGITVYTVDGRAWRGVVDFTDKMPMGKPIRRLVLRQVEDGGQHESTEVFIDIRHIVAVRNWTG
jgi:hypothetical protein